MKLQNWLKSWKDLIAAGLVMRFKTTPTKRSNPGRTIATTGENLEERAVPTAAVIDVQQTADDYMYADIAAASQTPPEAQAHNETPDYLSSAAFDATATPLTPKQERQKARQDKHDLTSSKSYDAAEMKVAAASRKKTPGIHPDKSGLTVHVSSNTDGHVDAGASEKIEEVDFINGKKPVTIKSLGGVLSGDGADEVLSISAKYNGVTVATVTAQGAGSINLGTFDVGILKNGTASFEIWVTMKPTAHGGTVVYETNRASARHPRNSLALTLDTGNVEKSTFTGGTAQPALNPHIIIVTNNGTNVEEGGMKTFGVYLDAAPPTDNYVVNLSTADAGALGLSTTTLVYNKSNYGMMQTVTMTGVEDADFNDESVLVTATSQFDTKSFTATVNDNDQQSGGNEGFNLTGPSSIQENGSGTYTITLNGPATSSVTFNVSTSDPGAAMTQVTQVTIPAGQTSQTFIVSGVSDADTNNENVTLFASVNDALSPSEYDVLNDKTLGIVVIDVTTGGVRNVTWDVVIAVSTSGPIKVQGVFFEHTYATRDFFAIADLDANGDVDTRLGILHNTDSNGAGAVTFDPTVIPQNAALQIRALGTSAETLDRADNVVIVAIGTDGRVYQLKEGHGLTWNDQIKAWFMDISQGILQP